VPLDSTAHRLKLNEEAVRAGAQTDLDDLGIAKNSREEKAAARKHKTPEELANEARHNAEMAKLYASTCSRSSRPADSGARRIEKEV